VGVRRKQRSAHRDRRRRNGGSGRCSGQGNRVRRLAARVRVRERCAATWPSSSGGAGRSVATCCVAYNIPRMLFATRHAVCHAACIQQYDAPRGKQHAALHTMLFATATRHAACHAACCLPRGTHTTVRRAAWHTACRVAYNSTTRRVAGMGRSEQTTPRSDEPVLDFGHRQARRLGQLPLHVLGRVAAGGRSARSSTRRPSAACNCIPRRIADAVQAPLRSTITRVLRCEHAEKMAAYRTHIARVVFTCGRAARRAPLRCSQCGVMRAAASVACHARCVACHARCVACHARCVACHARCVA
jgi:hypothetical protein